MDFFSAMNLAPMTGVKLATMIGLYLILPLAALTYYFSRLPRRTAEVKRVIDILGIDSEYQKVYKAEKLRYYLIAVAYVSIISGAGLMLLFFGTKIGFPNGEFPTLNINGTEFPQKGSRLVLGMAFLGAYVWGFQYIFRRYSLNYLLPGVFYNLSMRMILASVVTLVIYNAFTALTGGAALTGDAVGGTAMTADNNSSGGITANIWPALAFMIGMFPQRALRWLTGRIPLFSSETNPSVRETPLEMIEGIESHDILLLGELGIDSCYDMANVDFVPLLLKTPYSARQLIDWILQAKLRMYFGQAVRDLRKSSVRTIIDLEPLTDDDLEDLAKETTLTMSALQRAKSSAEKNTEINRLRDVGQLLGKYWTKENESVEERSKESNKQSSEEINCYTVIK